MESPTGIDLNGRVASVMIYLKIREGHEEDYRRWQDRVDALARDFDGFEDTELYPACASERNEWAAVYRFSDIDRLTGWLNSPAHRELLDEGRSLFDRPAKQEVLIGGAPSREVVTAVISHKVRPGREQDFLRWQDRIEKAQEEFPGFMGFELFKPVPGIQDNWVTVVRFAARENLDEWLGSDVRKELLDEGRECVVSYDVRKIRSSFSGWFRFGEGEEGPPPRWKQTMSVVLPLYPTVMILNLTLGKGLTAAKAPGYIALFISNVVTVSLLTWVLMPLINKFFAFWLVRGRTNSSIANVGGTAIIVLSSLLFITVFGLITT
jgi:antibiotic biosynthesis monooxygenase (ABM) superfamily enzyme